MDELDKRVRAAAALLLAEHKRDLSKMNPPPHLNSSKPGEYPRARTLNLRNSVDMQKMGPAHYRVGYRSNAEYIVFLARRARLTIVDAATRLRDRLTRIIRGS